MYHPSQATSERSSSGCRSPVAFISGAFLEGPIDARVHHQTSPNNDARYQGLIPDPLILKQKISVPYSMYERSEQRSKYRNQDDIVYLDDDIGKFDKHAKRTDQNDGSRSERVSDRVDKKERKTRTRGQGRTGRPRKFNRVRSSRRFNHIRGTDMRKTRKRQRHRGNAPIQLSDGLSSWHTGQNGVKTLTPLEQFSQRWMQPTVPKKDDDSHKKTGGMDLASLGQMGSSGATGLLPMEHNDACTKILNRSVSPFWFTAAVLSVVLPSNFEAESHMWLPQKHWRDVQSYGNAILNAEENYDYLHSQALKSFVASPNDTPESEMPDSKAPQSRGRRQLFDALKLSESPKNAIEATLKLLDDYDLDRRNGIYSKDYEISSISHRFRTQSSVERVQGDSENAIRKELHKKLRDRMVELEKQSKDRPQSENFSSDVYIRDRRIERHISYFWIDAPLEFDWSSLIEGLDLQYMAVKRTSMGTLLFQDLEEYIAKIQKIKTIKELDEQVALVQQSLVDHPRITINVPSRPQVKMYAINGKETNEASKEIESVILQTSNDHSPTLLVSPTKPRELIISPPYMKQYLDRSQGALISVDIRLDYDTMDTVEEHAEDFQKLMRVLDDKRTKLLAHQSEEAVHDDELNALKAQRDTRLRLIDDLAREVHTTRVMDMINNKRSPMTASMYKTLSQVCQDDEDDTSVGMQVKRFPSQYLDDDEVKIGDDLHLRIIVEPGEWQMQSSLRNHLFVPKNLPNHDLAKLTPSMKDWFTLYHSPQVSDDKAKTFEDAGRLEIRLENTLPGIAETRLEGKDIGLATVDVNQLDERIRDYYLKPMGLDTSVEKSVHGLGVGLQDVIGVKPNRGQLFTTLPMLLEIALDPNNDLHVGDTIVFKNAVGQFDNWGLKRSHEGATNVNRKGIVDAYTKQCATGREIKRPNWLDYSLREGKWASLRQSLDIQIQVVCRNCECFEGKKKLLNQAVAAQKAKKKKFEERNRIERKNALKSEQIKEKKEKEKRLMMIDGKKK